jgi:hypothetical protein
VKSSPVFIVGLMWNGSEADMKAVFFLVGLLVAGLTPTYAEDRPLPPIAQGEIGARGTQTYTVALTAGDAITGTFELKGISGSFVASQPGGKTISKFTLFGQGQMRVGFIAPLGGTYQILIVNRAALIALLGRSGPR